jgi:alkylhydroperoxidase family enzyme
MLRWLMRRRIAAFERRWQYDMSYVRDILEADPRALLALNGVMGISRYRRDIPAAPWYAAKLVAAMEADCGPCAQLVVAMAERAGVAPSILSAIVRRDAVTLPDDVLIAMRFAERVLARDPEAESLRDDVLARWGERGLVSLGFAITLGGFFPVLKAVLGRARECRRLVVAGESLPVLAVTA